MALPQGLVAGSVPDGGTGVGGSWCLCAGRVPPGDRRAFSEGRRGAQSRVLVWQRQGDAWSDGLEDAGGHWGPPACLQPQTALLPFSAGSPWGRGPWELLVPRAKWHHGCVGREQKSLPSLLLLPLPGNCWSNTFLAYLSTPRETWDEGRGAPPPHEGQRPAWHCPSQGPDPAKHEQVSPRAAAPISPGREQVLGDRVRAHIFGGQLAAEPVLGHF